MTTARNSEVKAWEELVTIPSYPEQAPDKNPMFFEKRVYQGSSGKVYPNAFTDRVSNEKSDKTYRAVFLENDYVRLMILPEIGGRIHVGQDKINGYDFFYRQNVIKPALVGLLGPWISGGVEFNWPQHHRPSTYMPVQHTIEQHDDGSSTIWLSEHEPMQRMKGMVGICLHPGKSYIEAKVRLYNRTPFVQTFLWWANVGIRVHDHYQAFFPPDVTYVADHAKRAMSSFPSAQNYYYGVDYRKGVDISWYKNIPVPTSYMVTESKYDFFGGYDYQQKAGMVHYANRHLAPGKKLWTWGNAEFGYAWDRNLTDSDGPYIELMAGVFTDNQPDFSWFHPYETRTWSQFWYPIQQIGPVKNANRAAAVNVEQEGEQIKVGLCVTEAFEGADLIVSADGKTVLEERVDLKPGEPVLRECHGSGDVLLTLTNRDGEEIIQYKSDKRKERAALPSPASEPASPKEIPSSDELYVTGLHLEQYRHATRYPEPYWEEALRRDPLDSRCNTALGLLKLRRGEFLHAEKHFRAAIQRLTRRNPNPEDGSAYYCLGLALQYQSRDEEACAAYYKAAWNYAWQSASYFHLAQIDCCRNQPKKALEHLQLSLAANPGNLNARNLKTSLLRRSGQKSDARACALETAQTDPLDLWSQWELSLLSESLPVHPGEGSIRGAGTTVVQLTLDLAFDYMGAGLWSDASSVLTSFKNKNQGRVYPIIDYALAYCAEKLGNHEFANCARADAMKASPDYCFPARIEEMIVLQSAIATNPADARAHYYLGNLLYDKKRYTEAIKEWEQSVDNDPSFAIPWRNLGIAYFNALHDSEKALAAYETAFNTNPSDARLLYELDQLRKRIGLSPAERILILEKYPDLVAQRDDLTVEMITLLNQTGQPDKALQMLSCRRFNPWEGGEGLVSGQYVWSHLLIGRSLLESEDHEKALAHFEAAREYPHHLGEGKHLLTQETHLDYFTGVALSKLGRVEEARQYWAKAGNSESPINWMSYFRALSLEALGRSAEATRVLEQMRAFAKQQLEIEPKIDYFATSLPNLLLFEDDLRKRNRIEALLSMALAELGERKIEEASKLLAEVLSLDCNQIVAQEEVRALNWSRREKAAVVQ